MKVVSVQNFICIAAVCQSTEGKLLSVKQIEMLELTLKAPITTAADDKFCDIFPSFRQK